MSKYEVLLALPCGAAGFLLAACILVAIRKDTWEQALRDSWMCFAGFVAFAVSAYLHAK